MRLDNATSLVVRLFALALLVLTVPMGLIWGVTQDVFEQGMAPELDRKAAVVGHDLADQLERAVGYGIPVDRLVGVEDFFAPVLQANEELRYLAVTDAEGRVLFLSGAEASELEPHYRTADVEGPVSERLVTIGAYDDLSLPLSVKGTRVGQVHVGVAAGYVHRRVAGIMGDVAVVMIVSLLLAAEFLLFVVAVNVTGPLRRVGRIVEQVRRNDFTRLPADRSGDEVGRFVRRVADAVRSVDDAYRRLAGYVDEVRSAHFDPRVVERVAAIQGRIGFLYRFAPEGAPQAMHLRNGLDMRLALLLFTFAEELSRPFLPLYAASLPSPLSWLDPSMAMAVPVAVFMAAVALATPWAGAISSRFGSRPVFLAGLVPAILGLVMSGLALTVADLALWRVLTGLGYALSTMACQGYMSRAAQEGRRAQGMGLFVGAVLTASVCGMALGGILVERIGFRHVFFVAAGIALLSGLPVLGLVEPANHEERGRGAALRDLFTLLRNWRFSALMLFAAIPSKMALTGVTFFLVPLHLWNLGYGFGDIARVLLIYPLTVVVLSPVVSKLADSSGWRVGLVALGGLVGGAGLLMPALGPGLPPVLLALLCLGLAQGLSASPLLAALPDICWIECRAIGHTNVLAQVRLLERVGSVAGPLVAAAMIPVTGHSGAMVALGVVVLAAALLFALMAPAYGSGPHLQTEVR